MKIERIAISNFRCFGPDPITVELEAGVTALVGNNGSGKTAVFGALAKLFGTSVSERTLRKSDFHVPLASARVESGTSLYIDCVLGFPELDGEEENDDSAVPEAFMLRLLEAPLDEDEIALQRISTKAETLSKTTRSFMKNQPIDKVSARPLVNLIIEMIGEATIRQSTPSYQRQADFDRVKDGFVALLEESLTGADTWATALDRFEGKDQVPLMTIHKSKGLEFHTIVFFGLDSQSWWSLTPSRADELKSFFVAFTRARQRAFFTFCQARGGRIAWLEDILGAAVPRISGESIA